MSFQTMARACALAALAAMAAACSNPAADAKKAQQNTLNEAQPQIDEFNRLSIDLAVSPRPTSSSSASEIAAYEAKVNRLEALGNNLQRLDGRNGVYITGVGWPQHRDRIDSLRRAIAQARSGRAVRADAERSVGAAAREYDSLERENEVARGDLQRMGQPTVDWPRERLALYERMLSAMVSRMDRQIVLMRQMNSDPNALALMMGERAVQNARLENVRATRTQAGLRDLR